MTRYSPTLGTRPEGSANKLQSTWSSIFSHLPSFLFQVVLRTWRGNLVVGIWNTVVPCFTRNGSPATMVSHPVPTASLMPRPPHRVRRASCLWHVGTPDRTDPAKLPAGTLGQQPAGHASLSVGLAFALLSALAKRLFLGLLPLALLVVLRLL